MILGREGWQQERGGEWIPPPLREEESPPNHIERDGGDGWSWHLHRITGGENGDTKLVYNFASNPNSHPILPHPMNSNGWLLQPSGGRGDLAFGPTQPNSLAKKFPWRLIKWGEAPPPRGVFFLHPFLTVCFSSKNGGTLFDHQKRIPPDHICVGGYMI